MGACYLPGAYMHGRSKDLLYFQLFQQITYSSNICNGIHISHFVEVDLIHGDSMDMAFCLGDKIVDCQYMTAHSFRDLQMGKNVGDPCHIIVGMVMGMMMVVFKTLLVHMGMFFLIPYENVHMGSCDSAFLGFFHAEADTGDPQMVQLLHRSGGIFRKLQQSGGEHITGSAHTAVKV